ncbi:MAG: hypothetical protein AB7H66_17325 [Hyphomonadaceae bacterium]
MKLEPQNAQEAIKIKTKAGKEQNGEEQKRERRKAPRYTLVWTEEVQALRDISTDEVIELRKKALWRIRLAEAARNNDPAIAKFGAAADIDDLIWSKFDVGRHWFMLEYRAREIREYVVTLTTPPSPNDIPPPPGKTLLHRAGPDGPSPAQPRRKTGKDETASALVLPGVEGVITALLSLTRRKLSRGLEMYKSCFAPQLSQRFGEFYRNQSYSARDFVASLRRALRRIASTLATRCISFTRLGERDARRVSFEAHLEPRCVGQRSGFHILLYSWVRDEPPPVDWTADLFGVLPIDWAANLFGVLPQEERAIL